VVGPSVEEGVVEGEAREGEVPDRAEEPKPVGTKEKRIAEPDADPDAEARDERVVHERVVERIVEDGVVHAQMPVSHVAVIPTVVSVIVLAVVPAVVLALVLVGVHFIAGFIDRGELRVTPRQARRSNEKSEHSCQVTETSKCGPRDVCHGDSSPLCCSW